MRFVFPLVLLCLVASVLHAEPAGSEIWQHLLTQADSAATRRQYDSAAVMAQSSFEFVSDDPQVPDSLRTAVCERVVDYFIRAARYDQAEPYLQKMLPQQIRMLGVDHPDVAHTLERLSLVKLRQAKLAYAEHLARQALSIYEKDTTVSELRIASCCEALALVLHYTKSKLPEAERLLKWALAIRRRQPGARPIDYAGTTFRLASIYRVWDQVPRADTLFHELLTLYEAEYGPTDLRVGSTLGNIGNLNLYLGNYAMAESYLRKALDIDLRHLPRRHPTIALMYFNIGVTLRCEQRLEESEQYIRQALELWETTSGPDHPDAAGAVEELARLKILQGDHEKSLQLLSRALAVRREEFRSNYYILSEQSATEYSNKLRLAVSDYLSCYFQLKAPSDIVTDSACNWLLNCKGELSEIAFRRAHRFHARLDPITGPLADSIATIRRRLAASYARLYDENEHQGWFKVDSLENALADVETAFARACAAVDSSYSNIEWSVAEARKALPASATLLEFMKYGDPERSPTDPTNGRYAVATISAEEIRLVDLGPAFVIDSLIRLYQAEADSAFTGPADRNSDRLQRTSNLLESMYATLWKPIESVVRDTGAVLVAPDGSLNNVSFGTLKHDSTYLVERYCIRYLSASRDLRHPADEQRVNTGLLALGDPDFNATVGERRQAAGQMQTFSLSWEEFQAPTGLRNPHKSCEYFSEVTVDPLPYTRREISRIAAGWQGRSKGPVEILSGAAASEESFVREAPAKGVIHIATHGFDRPVDCSDITDSALGGASIDPLLSSGLFLAGSNLHGDGANAPGAEDGLLTALEVSCLDLRGTQLVVLSACQSGLGTVRVGEGVFGLRRAFQEAGARNVICALWRIPDKETGQVMASLYDRAGDDLALALRRVALDRIAQQRSKNLPDNPFAWGAFVVAGDGVIAQR